MTLVRASRATSLGVSFPFFALYCLAGCLSATAIPRAALAQQNSHGPDDRRGSEGARILQADDTGENDQSADDPQRVNESYQPKGIDLGNFLLFPLLDISESYNSNVYATETNRKGDVTTHIAPEIRLRSRFSNDDQLNVMARMDQAIFATYNHDNHLDAITRVDGVYNVSSTTEFRGIVNLNQTYEDRGSPDDKDASEPTRTRNVEIDNALKERFGRFTLTEELTGARRDFQDAPRFNNTPLDNGDRDRFEASASVRGDYELFPGYAGVLKGTYNTVSFDDKYDQYGIQRSSDGYRVETGFAVDVTQVIKGNFLIGYLSQNVADPRLPSPQGLAFRASFNWTPDKMTIIVPTLERTIEQTTLNNASVIVRSGGGLLVRHELQRNIVLTASTDIYNDSFRGIARNDWLYDGRIRAIWSLSSEYYIGGEIGYRRRTSTEAGNSFSEGIGLMHFGIRL